MKNTWYRLVCLAMFGLIAPGLQAQQQPPVQLQIPALLQADQKLKANQARIDAAYVAMETVQKAGAYIESLTELIDKGTLGLPVGIKKGGYELIVQRIEHNNETGLTSMYATCAFQLKEGGTRIAFEGSAIIDGQRGLGGGGSLALMTPVQIKMGNVATILLKEGTKVHYGCDGIDYFKAVMELFVTSSTLIPVDGQGKPTNQAISAGFEGEFSDFENYTASLQFNQQFKISGLDDLIFFLKGAAIDQSQSETPSLVKFPDGYLTGGDAERKLWKGVAITEASVSMPAIFKKSDTDTSSQMSNRMTIALREVLIDAEGFTGQAEVLDLMNSGIRNPEQWDITLAKVSVDIQKNKVLGIGFGGELNIPPFGKNSLLPYEAHYNQSTRQFDFIAKLAGTFDFPALYSSVTLNSNSTVEILFKNNSIYPSINASGLLTIKAPVGKPNDTTSQLTVPDITFENLQISREAPYLKVGAIGVAGKLKTPRVAGFELSISDIVGYENANSSGLSLTAGVSMTQMFAGQATLLLEGDYAKWKFRKVNISEVGLKYESTAFTINGKVAFKNGDVVYGNGFRGDIGLKVINQFNLDAVGVFGSVNSYNYFLTDVFFESLTTGLPVPPAFAFYGIGGGLYSHMQQDREGGKASDFGKALSGINYYPDNQVSMGFMASTMFGLQGSASTLSAKVTLELQFNRNWGLNFVQLYGDAAMMQLPATLGSLTDNLQEALDVVKANKGEVKEKSKADLGTPKLQALLKASMFMRYDVSAQTFSADLKTYLTTGAVNGSGPGNLLGAASAYFSPDKWYLYAGTPQNRMGISILGIGKADGYFMVGDDIPELPLPPQKVLQFFTAQQQATLNSRSTSELNTGRGIAFGASLQAGYNGECGPFYASFGLGVGAEFLLKNYGVNAYCIGGQSSIGINGWYARGQAWAYLDGNIGIQARVMKKTRRFDILKVGAGALLQGAGPNPFYFAGIVGGKFSVMGGLVKGSCNFEFKLGSECKVGGGSPFGEEVIAQLTPANSEKDVNVFAAPQVLFNIPIGLEMEIDEDEGQKAWYRINLVSFEVKQKETGLKIQGKTSFNDDRTVYMIDPQEPLQSYKQFVAYAKVSFERKLNGKWIEVKGADGKPEYEEKAVEFTSGERPSTILPEHVKYSYPLAYQYNFYPKEYQQGYVMVTKNYTYLFSDCPPEFKQVLRITSSAGSSVETTFSYKAEENGETRFEINFPMDKVSFAKDEIYHLAIVNVPRQSNATIASNVSTSTSNLDGAAQAGGEASVNKKQAEGNIALLDEKEIYGLHFRTSSYNTFADKMREIPQDPGVVFQEYPYVYQLISNIYDKTTVTEVFDDKEAPTLNKDNQLIRLVPIYESTPWYTSKVGPAMYGNQALLALANMSTLTPPASPDAMSINLMTSGNALSQDMVQSNSRATLSRWGSVGYKVPRYMDKDFIAMRNAIANRSISGTTNTQIANEFMAMDHLPPIRNGEYVIRMDYTLPGKNQVTSSVQRTIKLSDFID